MTDLIAFILSFYIETPVVAGIITGAIVFGIPLYAVGWFHGGEAAARRVNAWIRHDDEAPGDVPNLPPARERKLNTVAHRESLS